MVLPAVAQSLLAVVPHSVARAESVSSCYVARERFARPG
jgi:hypothetical protein